MGLQVLQGKDMGLPRGLVGCGGYGRLRLQWTQRPVLQLTRACQYMHGTTVLNQGLGRGTTRPLSAGRWHCHASVLEGVYVCAAVHQLRGSLLGRLSLSLIIRCLCIMAHNVFIGESYCKNLIFNRFLCRWCTLQLIISLNVVLG